MNLTALKTELTDDPLARGYAGMNDEQSAVSLNTADRQPNRESLTGGMFAASVVRTEVAALASADDKDYVWALMSAGDMPLTANLTSELKGIFGAGTATRANLIALLKRPGSRAEELGLGFVTPSHVADARRLS
jgi:hypothetical protein